MGRQRSRANWGLRGLLLGLAAAAVAYVVMSAWWQARNTPYELGDLILPRLVDILVVAWFFWIGSAIGSFLNVVAWRVPRGRSINGWSHCPWCATRLAAQDNWPVFGWIALRGRCRTCRLPISPRYPIVELSVGLTITALGWAEVYSGGENLPWREPTGSDAPLSVPLIGADMIAIGIYHAVAIAGSWALGLVRFDDHRLPRSLVTWVLALVILPMLLWPPLMIVPWQAAVPENWRPGGVLNAVMRLITSLVAAAVVGRSMTRYLCPTADPKLDPTGRGTGRSLDLIAMLCVPALVVGWQAFLTVALIAVAIAAVLMRRWGLRRDGLAWLGVSLPIATTVQIVFWRLLEEWPYAPGVGSPPWVILAAAGLILIVPAWLRTAPQRQEETSATRESPFHPDTNRESAVRSEESD